MYWPTIPALIHPSQPLNTYSAWLFILFMIMVGYLLNALLFSGISEIVNSEDEFDSRSIWKWLNTEKSKATFLALECVKFIPPWSAIKKPSGLRVPLLSLISNTFYNDCVIFIIGVNILSSMVEIIADMELLPEYMFLVYYMLDALMHLYVVGFKYRSLIDLCFMRDSIYRPYLNLDWRCLYFSGMLHCESTWWRAMLTIYTKMSISWIRIHPNFLPLSDSVRFRFMISSFAIDSRGIFITG